MVAKSDDFIRISFKSLLIRNLVPKIKVVAIFCGQTKMATKNGHKNFGNFLTQVFIPENNGSHQPRFVSG